MKTEAAKAAAMLRKEIRAKHPDLKFTCRSETYAGGDSIRVGMEDQPRSIYKDVERMADKYQYGHFDGMYDIYEYSNVKEHPQVKFVFVRNEMSDEKKQEVFDLIRKKWSGGDELPPKYEDAANTMFHGQWISQFVWQEFNRDHV